jgi:hypothetical protein
MISEKMPNFSAGPERKKELGALKYVSQQMKDAISKEDYEQATYLRDAQERLSKNNQPLAYISEADILGEARLDNEKFEAKDEADDPALRAWQGIRSKQMADMFLGKDIVKFSSFSSYLGGDGKYLAGFVNDLWSDVKKYKHHQDADEKAEFIATLYNSRTEVEELVNLAKSKIDDIFQTYNEREPVLKAAAEKIPSRFPGLPKTQDILRERIDAMPDFISKPLAYWHGLYDNTRRIADDLETAIKEMNQ